LGAVSPQGGQEKGFLDPRGGKPEKSRVKQQRTKTKRRFFPQTQKGRVSPAWGPRRGAGPKGGGGRNFLRKSQKGGPFLNFFFLLFFFGGRVGFRKHGVFQFGGRPGGGKQPTGYKGGKTKQKHKKLFFFFYQKGIPRGGHLFCASFAWGKERGGSGPQPGRISLAI